MFKEVILRDTSPNALTRQDRSRGYNVGGKSPGRKGKGSFRGPGGVVGELDLRKLPLRGLKTSDFNFA